MSLPEQTRAQWLESRRHSVGASESAALFGLHPYHSPLSLYYEKTNDAPPSDEETSYQEWGKLLEPVLAEKYARVTGRLVHTIPLFAMPHPVHSFITATLDNLFQTREPPPIIGALELKTADHFDADEELPVHWQMQIQQQMAVTGMKHGSFAILGPFRKFYTIDIERNDAFIEVLIAHIADFWLNHVIPRVPPDPDSHVATTAALKKLYPHEDGSIVELPADYADMAQRLAYVKDEIKALESEERNIENHVRASIGAATYGVLPDGTGWKLATVERAGYEVKPTTFRALRRQMKAIKFLKSG